jgi:hypothetical protein
VLSEEIEMKNMYSDLEQRYLGITGFKNRSEINFAKLICNDAGFQRKDSAVMFGFLCSEKRLADPASEGSRSPPLNDIPDLVKQVPFYGLPMIHYHSKSYDTLADQVSRVFETGKMYENGSCRAVQLNVVWPSIEQVNTILSRMPELKMVLQLNRPATEGLSIEEIAKRAGEYDGLVKYALIDLSGGEGREFDLARGVDMLCALYETMPRTRMGNAGGLEGRNVADMVGYVTTRVFRHMWKKSRGRLGSLDEEVDRRYEFCVDAEGRLRYDCDKHSGFNWEGVGDYVYEAAPFF